MIDRKAVVSLTAWAVVLLFAAVVLVSAALASGRGKERSYNERAAILSLRSLAAAEKTVKEADLDRNGAPDFWTGDVATLADWTSDAGGKPAPLIFPGVAASDPRPRKPPKRPPSPFCGYHFAALPVAEAAVDALPTHPFRFAFCAYPAKYGESGRDTFLIDERGTVHSCDTQGKPPAAWPPEAEPVARLVDE